MADRAQKTGAKKTPAAARPRRAATATKKLRVDPESLFETGIIGIGLLRNGRLARCNRRLAAMFGYPPQAIIGTAIRRLYPSAEAHEAREAQIDAALAKNDSFTGDIQFRRRDGSLFWANCSVTAVNRKDRAKGAVWVVQDVTERRQSETAGARIAAIIEHSNDAIVSRALDGTILSWNAAAERLLGYSADETIGRSINIILPPGNHSNVEKNSELLLGGGQVPPTETVRLTKDGRAIDVLSSVSPITNETGAIIGAAIIIRDISALKHAERELQRKAALAQLLEALARAANEAVTPEEALRACLARICDYGNWMIGRVGTFARGQPMDIPQSSIWHGRQLERFREFIESSNRFNYRARTGKFINLVLHQKKPAWVSDFDATPGSGRLTDTAKFGIRSGFAFPVVVGDEVLAFLEFFADEVRPPDTEFLDAIGNIAGQLARVIERNYTEELRAQLAAIVESSNDAIVSRAPDGTVLTWNKGAERLFGYTAAEIIGRDILVLVPPDRIAEVQRNLASTTRGVTTPHYETVRLAKNGRLVDVSISAAPIRAVFGKVPRVALIFRDITARKQVEERVRRLAHYDSLTDLPNRMLFYDRLAQAISLARRDRHELALLYLDLDKFKTVNDTFGHDAGDELLKHAAERIRGEVRESDTVARIGGDEFTVILPRISSREDVAKVAEKMIDALAVPFHVTSEQRQVGIGSSIGIAIFPDDAQDMDALVKAADAAMYNAKQVRNSFRFCNA